MSAFNRNRFVRFLRCGRALWLALIVVALGGESAGAQYGGMPMMPGMIPYVPRSNRTNNNPNNPYSNPNSQANRGPQPFSGSATITAVGSVGLEVTDANGNHWAVKPDKNCVIEVTGTADPSFLKPDMLVRFTAQFDKKGNATAPVNELELVSPQALMNSIKQEVAGKKEVADNVNGAIIGHIKTIKNNQLTVQTTNGAYTATLGANPSIKVNVSDLRWAQAGDKLDANGYYTQQGFALAKEMRVTLSSPLGESTKKKAAGSATASK